MINIKKLLEEYKNAQRHAEERKTAIEELKEILGENVKEDETNEDAFPTPDFCGGYIDFNGLDHPMVIRLIQALGGSYKKEPSAGGGLNYIRKDPLPRCGLTIRFWSAKPPPSCRVEEYEEVIPSHYEPERTVRRVRVVCPETVLETQEETDPQPMKDRDDPTF